MAGYAHPETLVETGWVEDHRADRGVRLVEVDVDTAAYEEGHVPGAIAWNWSTQLCDTVRRDIIPKEAFERLMSEFGISRNTTVVLYGDNNNWSAAWALWQVEIVSYRLGPRWYCQIDNVDPGARLTRRFADSREEAERLAIDRAREMLERTRTYEV